MQATAEFYIPEIDDDYREHFHAIYGADHPDEKIFAAVYGGQPLQNIYQSITFTADEQQIETLTATLTLNPATGVALPPLEIKNISLRQFLVSGLPLPQWREQGYLDSSDLWVCRKRQTNGTCKNRDYWSLLDAQYRLELCHSEISRWSIFFKRDGDTEPIGGADIPEHKHFQRIELVNNCTTTTGFEFRLHWNDQLYHGSFGSRPRKILRSIYTALSERQAGSLAKQDLPARIEGVSNFWRFYRASEDKGPSTPLKPTMDIEVEPRYSKKDPSFSPLPLDVTSYLGPINYKRWGQTSEYLDKAKHRRLMYRIVAQDKSESKEPPETYEQLKNSKFIELPNFEPNGIYNFHQEKRVKKQGYRWLYDIETCTLHRLEGGKYSLTLLRDCEIGQFQLRKIVIGNISLAQLPLYPDIYTLHRFGYSARETNMDYCPNFKPPTRVEDLAPYAFMLAGEQLESAQNYILPESFGIERLILSRDKDNPHRLTIDAMSFERILPLWQASIDLPEIVFNKA